MTLQGLYGITDGSTGRELLEKVNLAVQGGLSILQYRDKTDDYPRRLQDAMDLREICCQHNIPFIINDDIQLAKTLHADGVHLGQSDEDLKTARRLLGNDAIIGISCYNQIALARKAQQQGANYVAFGAFFPSPTKPNAPKVSLETLSQARAEIHLPICGIGGITLDNAFQVIDNGADMVAVISDLFAASDIKKTAGEFTQLFTNPVALGQLH